MGLLTILIATFLCIGGVSEQTLDNDRMSKDDLEKLPPEQTKTPRDPTARLLTMDDFADLDRKIIELGRAIALNPKDANAFVKRGQFYGSKCDYDQAIADFDRALSLAPNDARAHYFRGLAWHLKNEPKRAIADYDKAIELDPTKKLYRDNREKAERAIGHARPRPVHKTSQNPQEALPASLSGWRNITPSFFLPTLRNSASRAAVFKTPTHRDGW